MLFLMFTGQGSQFVGMGRDLYERFDIVKKVLDRANNALGFDLVRLMFEGPEKELTLTENAQPAILSVSFAVYSLLKSETDFDFNVVAGHSLGEYTALVAAGSMEFEDAVVAVNHRGRFMQQAVPEGLGAMAAILTDKHERVEELCRQVSAEGEEYYCDIANYNAKKQIIISGYKKGVDQVSLFAKEESLGKVIPLNVSAPFHCKLMEPVKEKLEKVLDGIDFGKPKKPVIENVNSDLVQSAENIKYYLIEQITSPVRWMQNVERAMEMGCDRFVELGPKAVLAPMLKRDYRKANINYVVDLKSYQSYKDSV